MTMITFSFEKRANDAAGGCMHACFAGPGLILTRIPFSQLCIAPKMTLSPAFSSRWARAGARRQQRRHLSRPFISAYSLLAAWPSPPEKPRCATLRDEKKKTKENHKPGHILPAKYSVAQAANLGQGWGLAIPVQLPHLICKAELIPPCVSGKQKCKW